MKNNQKILVRLVFDWENHVDIFQQTPDCNGEWDNIKFTFDEIEDCDFLIVSNRLSREIKINCPENNKWLIAGEPPEKLFHDFRKSYKYFDKLIIQDPLFAADKRAFLSHGALPWHINKNYSYLKQLQPGSKERNVSCIMSNSMLFEVHKKRILFSNIFKEKLPDVDFFGKGTNYIEEKFDALYPYRYSLAIENSRTPHYWTEKIADCFLSWTVPIYYGAPNITEYFPENSMILIDIEKPEESVIKIRQALENNFWETHIDAVREARELVLNKYQFFPFIANLINVHSGNFSKKNYQLPYIPALWEMRGKASLIQKLNRIVKAVIKKIIKSGFNCNLHI